MIKLSEHLKLYNNRYFIILAIFFTFIFTILTMPRNSWAYPIQNLDTPTHLNFIKELYDHGLFKAFNLKFEGGFYPPLFHLISCFWMYFGVNVAFGANLTYCFAAGVIFPIGMLKLYRSLCKYDLLKIKLNKTFSEILVILLSVSFSIFPLQLISIGILYSYCLAFCFIPYIIAFFVAILYNKLHCTKSNRKNTINKYIKLLDVFYFVLFSIFCLLSQPRAFFSVIIICSVIFIFWILNMWKINKIIAIKYLISFFVIVTFIVFCCVIYVIMRLNPELLLHPEQWFNGGGSQIDRSLFDAFIDYFSLSPFFVTSNIAVAFINAVLIIFVCIISTIKKKNYQILNSFIVLFLIFGILYILSSSGSNAIINIITAPWYKNPWRIHVILPLLLGIFIVVIIDYLYRCFNVKFDSKNNNRVFAIFLIIIYSLCMILALLIDSSYRNQTINLIYNEVSIDNSSNSLNRSKIDFFNNISQSIDVNDSIILSDPTNSSTYAYALNGINLIFPIPNPRITDSQIMLNAVASFNNQNFTDVCNATSKTLYFMDLGIDNLVPYPNASMFASFHNRSIINELLYNRKMSVVLGVDQNSKDTISQNFALYKINCNN